VSSDRVRLDAGSRLSESEVAALVRRAIEIDAHRGGAGDLDLADVRQVVAEVGVSDAAFAQALSEWRAGALVPPRPAWSTDRPTGGLAVAERIVPLAPAAASARLHAVLGKQCFDRIRRVGADSEYVRRRGLMADLQRGLNLRGQMRLKDVARLMVAVQPTGEVCTRIRLSVDLRSYRLGILVGAVGGPLAAGAAVALGAVPGPDVLLLGLPAGAALSAGGWVGARLATQARCGRVEDALAAVLDGLA
jgi:hypothetical protein